MNHNNEILALFQYLLSTGWMHIAVELLLLPPVLGLAWFAGHRIDQRIVHSAKAWRFGAVGLKQVLSPLIAALLITPVMLALAHYQPVKVLHLVRILLLAQGLIHLASYVLRYALPEAEWMQSTQRFLAATAWLGLTLHLTGLLPDLLDWLDAAAFQAGHQRISLLMVLEGLLSVTVSLIVALWISNLLDNRLQQNEHIQPTQRIILSKISRALLITLGLLFALPLAGIDITALSVFGGAVGVGLGFGLQKVASNYVSGFIILLDRSIHPDDVITVENRQGVVTRLTSRYTVVRSSDGTEAIVPNETLITSTVLNHTHAPSRKVVSLTVRLRPGANVELAMQHLEAAARAHPEVEQEPGPKVYIKSLACNGTELELVATLNKIPDNATPIRSDIYLDAWRRLHASGIRMG